MKAGLVRVFLSIIFLPMRSGLVSPRPSWILIVEDSHKGASSFFQDQLVQRRDKPPVLCQ